MADHAMAEDAQPYGRASRTAQRPRPLSIVHPHGPADEMLTASAASHPDRTALRTRTGAVSFAALDAMVDRCAAALRRLAGRPGTVVALASVLSPDFAFGYYGILRSANVVAPVNPYLREEQLAHVLGESGAGIALVDATTAARLTAVRHRLPQLREVVLIGSGPVRAEPGARTLSELSAEAGHLAGAALPHRPGAEDLACLHFTSGTTGAPKTVMLSHRNVTVNAAQVVHAHQLSGHCVMLNHLPTFHPMHLNSGILAGATQVLCDVPEAAESVRLANRYGASHYYSLPVRLAAMAGSSELAGLRLETVRVIASGGSALPAAAAETLSEHFGIPVIQGYGLAETSPLTHSDTPADWLPGTVGRPVAETECRIVEVSSRKVLGTGEVGEVQVRGPQLMLGYLEKSTAPAVDEDGWLSTGDVGRVADDGRLVLTDRLKDVFKRDNWLVSPTAVEHALQRCPEVRECVVVDHPDPSCGAVATAFVVLTGRAADFAGGPSASADLPAVVRRLTAEVNATLPYYQQLEHIEVVDSIPRSPNGKIPRRELRSRMAVLLQT